MWEIQSGLSFASFFIQFFRFLFLDTASCCGYNKRIAGNTVPRNNFCSCLLYYILLPLPPLGHPRAEYTILVIGNYYTYNGSVVLCC
jgi:hypothetical protein